MRQTPAQRHRTSAFVRTAKIPLCKRSPSAAPSYPEQLTGFLGFRHLRQTPAQRHRTSASVRTAKKPSTKDPACHPGHSGAAGGVLLTLIFTAGRMRCSGKLRQMPAGIDCTRRRPPEEEGSTHGAVCCASHAPPGHTPVRHPAERLSCRLQFPCARYSAYSSRHMLSCVMR